MPEKQNTQDGDKRPDVVSLSGQPGYRTAAGLAIETPPSIIEAVLTPDGAYVNITDPYDRAFPAREDEGLTKREYFAAMAMQGLLACPQVGMDDIPTAAVRYADALIDALNKALNEPITDEPEKDLPF